MSQRKRVSRSEPLPNISTASIRQLTVMPAEVLRLHLANYHLITTDTKAAMARRLFDAIQNSSSVPTTSSTNQCTSVATVTTPNSEGFHGIVSSSSSLSTSNLSTVPNVTPAQLATFLQLLAQTLHQNPSALSQQLSVSNTSSPLPLINLPPVFSVAQHASAVTQPAILTSTISHALPLRPQGTNDIALSPASISPSPAVATSGVGTDPSMSLSLPPVPLAIQQQILRGEFIDFTTLMPKVMFSAANTAFSTNVNRSTVRSAKIDSFSSWLDAWNVYIATIVAHNPSRASELLGYQRLIHSASKHFSTAAWLKYDVQFRTLAACNPQLRWDLRHSELWLENLAFQNSSYSSRGHWPCTYC